jgi:hypothetical protein
MSRRRPGSQPQKTLTHPNDPGITVTCRKSTRAERRPLDGILSNHRRALLVYDRNGRVALDENGNPRVHVEQQWPYEAVEESLRISTVSMDGLEDENGNPIILAADKSNVGVLTEDWLDVSFDEAVENPVEGAPKTKKRQMSFAGWLVNEMAKPEAFDSDPTPPTSAPH